MVNLLPCKILVDTVEAATATGLPVARFQEWRTRGGGPPWCKIGRNVYYRVTDLEAWLEACRVAPSVPTIKSCRRGSYFGDALVASIGRTWGDGRVHEGLLAAEHLFKRVLAERICAFVEALADPHPFDEGPARAVRPAADGTLAFSIATPARGDVIVRYDPKTGGTSVGGEVAAWASGPIDLACIVFGLRRGRIVTVPEAVEHLLALHGLHALAIASDHSAGAEGA